MNPQFIETCYHILDNLDKEADPGRFYLRAGFLEVRKAFADARNALKKTRNVVNAVACDQAEHFILGANSPFSQYIKQYISDFDDVPQPGHLPIKGRNQIQFPNGCFMHVAVAAIQFALNKIAIARCFLKNFDFPASCVILDVHLAKHTLRDDATIDDAFDLIDDAVRCAAFDDFLFSNVQILDHYNDLHSVFKVNGTDQFFFSQSLVDTKSAVIEQCRAAPLLVWFQD